MHQERQGNRLVGQSRQTEENGRMSEAARGPLALLFLMIATVFLALHFVHLRADFPNHSPWVDWAKYTDEGWYGDAAIRHYLRGTWRLPGDFNPAAALPVWPFLEALVFRFTGVGIVAARALTVCVFACVLTLAFFIVRLNGGGKEPQQQSRTLFGAVAVLLMAVSPFLFVFTRMAILEPLLVLLMSSCLLAAYAVRSSRSPLVLAAFLGLLIAQEALHGLGHLKARLGLTNGLSTAGPEDSTSQDWLLSRSCMAGRQTAAELAAPLKLFAGSVMQAAGQHSCMADGQAAEGLAVLLLFVVGFGCRLGQAAATPCQPPTAVTPAVDRSCTWCDGPAIWPGNTRGGVRGNSLQSHSSRPPPAAEWRSAWRLGGR